MPQKPPTPEKKTQGDLFFVPWLLGRISNGDIQVDGYSFGHILRAVVRGGEAPPASGWWK